MRHKKRKTILLTRVDGIRFSSGEYIIQIDQDDMYLNNLLFEKLYNKAKKLDIDIIQFNRFTSINKTNFILEYNDIPKNIIISQPELKTAFYHKVNDNRLDYLLTRVIWDKFVRREIFLEAIDDLGDEYMNHKFHFYEDTIMSFELSQIANSFYYYEIEGYRHCIYYSEKTIDKNIAETTALNCLLFIKLLLYKIDPKYDRYYIFKEFQFCGCGELIRHLNKNDFDLGSEVLEVILELQRIYNNTAPELLSSANNLLSRFKK